MHQITQNRLWKTPISTWLLWLLAASVLAAGPAAPAAKSRTFLVLGVIASARDGEGVALLKAMQGSEAFAVRVGQQIDPDVVVQSITRDYVFFRTHGHVEKVRVGEQLDPASVSADYLPLNLNAGGIEKQGNVVRVTESLRNDVVKQQLSKVLMQAAAIPYYVNGELVGFRLSDIDAGSIYQKAGFIDGDIVTNINGQRLSDVGLAIRTLQGLKNESHVDVTYTRKGVEQTVQIEVQ